MLPIALCLFTIAAGEAPPAPPVAVTSSARWTRASASGEDRGFQEALDLRDSDDAGSDEWVSDLEADLQDDGGAPVARGRCYQESQIDASSFYFTLDVWAETAGQHAQADGAGSGGYRVDFLLGRPTRYIVRAHADASPGPNLSNVRLESAAGTVFELAPQAGEAVNLLTTGWLPAGRYALIGQASVLASGTDGAPDAHSGNAECELVFLGADAPEETAGMQESGRP
jgi:hypothetical protein